MHTSKKSENFLVTGEYSTETSQNLLRIVFRLAKKGKKVLYMAAKPPESLPIDDDYNGPIYRDMLMNITFSYVTDAANLIDVLLDFRQYQPRPDVIIVDFLHTFFDYFSDLDIDLSLHENFIECHMLMISAVYSAVDMFCNAYTSTTTNFMSIVCIDPKCNEIYNRFIPTIIDLYYYKKDSILPFDDLMEKFPHQV